ncbi:hypothetical protein SBA3_1680020 [Candidatus Sulfopaludibacter sp. SbA3]|nr:hypothetical protein SBA3_1680020 [Candidatus Sulfopaludibacter sp. SbA3]
MLQRKATVKQRSTWAGRTWKGLVVSARTTEKGVNTSRNRSILDSRQRLWRSGKCMKQVKGAMHGIQGWQFNTTEGRRTPVWGVDSRSSRVAMLKEKVVLRKTIERRSHTTKRRLEWVIILRW